MFTLFPSLFGDILLPGMRLSLDFTRNASCCSRETGEGQAQIFGSPPKMAVSVTTPTDKDLRREERFSTG
jgi:hypothetical protein